MCNSTNSALSQKKKGEDLRTPKEVAPETHNFSEASQWSGVCRAFPDP